MHFCCNIVLGGNGLTISGVCNPTTDMKLVILSHVFLILSLNFKRASLSQRLKEVQWTFMRFLKGEQTDMIPAATLKIELSRSSFD